MAREFVSGGCISTSSTKRVAWGNIMTSVSPVTCAMLFKIRSDGSSNYDVAWGYSTARWFFIINGAAGSTRKLSFNFVSPSGERGSGYISSNLTLNTWYTVIGGHDPAGGANNTFIRIYDATGAQIDNSTATNALSISSTSNALAAGYDSVRALSVNAQYKNFRVWSRTLTSGEMDALASNQYVDRINLELETLCNESDGITLRDSATISNTRPATLTGSPIFSPDVPSLFARSRVLNN